MNRAPPNSVRVRAMTSLKRYSTSPTPTWKPRRILFVYALVKQLFFLKRQVHTVQKVHTVPCAVSVERQLPDMIYH